MISEYHFELQKQNSSRDSVFTRIITVRKIKTMYVRLVRAQDASNCWITEARNEFKLATASGPAGTIVSFASRLQQPATTTFLSQIDPSRKANFMLRSRRASASLLAHYVFRPAPPSHIIARLSLLFLLLFFSSSFFFFSFPTFSCSSSSFLYPLPCARFLHHLLSFLPGPFSFSLRLLLRG